MLVARLRERELKHRIQGSWLAGQVARELKQIRLGNNPSSPTLLTHVISCVSWNYTVRVRIGRVN